MTTLAQLISFAQSDDVDDEAMALETIRMSKDGCTADESFLMCHPGTDFPHGPVDSWRVAIRHLREKGLIRDLGEKRTGPSSGRVQTVWVKGDDRDKVTAHRRKKLEKFPKDWLVDELARREKVDTAA